MIMFMIRTRPQDDDEDDDDYDAADDDDDDDDGNGEHDKACDKAVATRKARSDAEIAGAVAGFRV